MPTGVYKHPPQCGFQKGHTYTQSKEVRKRISEANKGKKLSKETRAKISKTQKEKTGPRYWTGRKMSLEHRRKLSKAKIGLLKGAKCHLWRGGIFLDPYPTNWTKTLRRSIRERDKYTCKVCGIKQAIYVHHIDYNKKNCNSNNLITLCHSCHAKTNSNREKWIRFFN